MDELIELMNKEIKKNYKSIRKFAAHIGLPATSLTTILSRPILGNASFAIINKMCKALNIDYSGEKPFVLNDRSLELLNMYSYLDDLGQHTVDAITRAEYVRCNSSSEEEYIAAFGGMKKSGGHSSEEADAKSTLKKILEDNNNVQ